VTQTSDIHAVLEGPGSVPVLYGVDTARGFFEIGNSDPQALARGTEVDARQPRLLLPSTALPEADVDARLTIGEVDAVDVTDTDSQYTVDLRRPIDDGAVHELLLSGGDS
jgi:hypothetical protein